MNRRLVVIGGGVIGLCTAWYCQQQGWHVTVIDRHPSRRTGCSFGNAGMLVPSHVVPLAAPGMVRLGLKWMWNPQSPFYIRPRLSWDLLRWLWQFRRHCHWRHVQQSAPLLRDLHFRSRALYETLQAELPDGFGLQQRGLLMLCKTQSGWQEETATAELAKRFDVPVEVLDPEATAARDPSVTMDVVGSVFYPQDCHLSPQRLMAALESSLIDRGCRFLWESEVTDFVTQGKRLAAIRWGREEVPADEVILCGGVWSAGLARSLDLAIPMQAGKGYSVTLEKPAQLPALCSLLHEARVAVTPIGSALRVGGTMELAGLDESVSQRRVAGIIAAMPQYFPAFRVADFAGLDAWSGLRPCAPDGLPYLGRTARWENLIVSTGHAMMGISLAAVSGQIVADLVAHRSPNIANWQQLSPDRFGPLRGV